MNSSSPHAKKSPSSNDHRNVDKSSQQPNLNLRSKIFELSSILDVAKVSDDNEFVGSLILMNQTNQFGLSNRQIHRKKT